MIIWFIPFCVYISELFSVLGSFVLCARVLAVPFGNLRVSLISFTLPYCQCADAAGTGGLPSDVSPDEVHSSVLESAEALYVNTHDRQLVSKVLTHVLRERVFPSDNWNSHSLAKFLISCK